MLPAYARVDLAFERGEGVWLIATNGDRYLDFASGVAVNALGHSHPHRGRGHHRAGQAQGHPRLQSLPHPGGRAAGRPAVRGELCRHGVLRQFRRRGDGRRDQDGAQVPVGERPSRALPHHHLRGLVSTAARWRRSRPPRTRSISTASGRSWTASTRCRSATSRRVKRAIGPETAGILIEPVQGEGGVRSAPPQFFRALRPLCDEHGLLLAFDEVQTGIGRLGEMFGYQKIGVTPDVMALAKGLGAGFPIGAVPRHRRGRQGHDARHPRLDLRRQSAGGGGRQRGARRGDQAGLPRSRPPASRCCSSSGSPRSRTGIPSVIAEVRGEGLLIGLRAWCRTAS